MPDSDIRRRADLAAIHVAKKQLRLDDATYRMLLKNLTGRESAGDLNAIQRGRVLNHMRTVGFAPRPAAAAKVERFDTDASDKQARMARGLWIELARAGKVRDSSERALRHFVKRVCGADSLRFATPSQLNQVIEALKSWDARVVKVDFTKGRNKQQ